MSAGAVSATTLQGPLLPLRATADGTHRRLLEGALVQFGERGFHGVSVREIAESAGIRPSSMYAHLESKEDLLFQLVLVGHQEHNSLLRAALASAAPTPPEQLDAVVHAHVRFHGEYPLLARVCNRELHALTAGNRVRVVAVRTDSEQVFEEIIRAGIDAGLFNREDAWLGVAAIAGMGVRISEWWADDRGYTLDQLADTYSRFALRMLSEHGPTA